VFLCTRTEPWENCRDDVGPIIRIGAPGAGIGMAVDALIRKRRPSAPAVSSPLDVYAAPMVDRDGNGVRLTLRI
jgi:hypothetical protein